MDWVAGEIRIERLRNLAQACSVAAGHQREAALGAAARVRAVQELLLAPEPPPIGAEPPPEPLEPAPECPGRRPAGVARLREGPLADLFRATDLRA